MRVQAFSIPSPAWVKFLQLRFVSHYGSEPVCALNELSVFGKSAVEDLEVCCRLEPCYPANSSAACVIGMEAVGETGSLPPWDILGSARARRHRVGESPLKCRSAHACRH